MKMSLMKMSLARPRFLNLSLTWGLSPLLALKLAAAPVAVERGFTAEFNPPTPTRVLVSRDVSWKLFKGTAEPEARWETLDEASLSDAWKSKTGGFGYGYPNEGTVLSDMKNGYSTAYIRHVFLVDEVIDPNRLRLQMDYDDGFIAFLDGREIARANAPGDGGKFAPFNSLATASHPAAPGTAGELMRLDSNAPALFVHEEDGPKIRHTLAIQGLNHGLADDAFALNPTLLVQDLFPVTTADSIQVSGKAELAGTASVTVNGAPAVFDAAAQTWSMNVALHGGMNRLVIQALDAGNGVLASLTNEVVRTAAVTTIGARSLSSNTTWEDSMGTIKVTGAVQIPANITLTIAAGTTVMFDTAASLRVHGGTLNVAGATNNPAFLLPLDGRTPWKGIAGNGPGTSINLRGAELVAGGVNLTNQVALVIEDSTLRDFSYDTDGTERFVVYTTDGGDATIRRSQFSRYFSIAFGFETTLRLEDSLFDFSEHDFMKPQGTKAGSFIRRCLLQRSTVGGTDGIDFGGAARLLIDKCTFHDINDKAISVEDSRVTITNCVIYNCGMGIASKDGSTTIAWNNTISRCTYGLAVYLKNPGATSADGLATNNIFWGNATNVTRKNPDTGASSSSATIEAGYNDIEGSSVYPGTGNINADPLFLDPAHGDFRLKSGSPAIGTGLGRVDMGAFLGQPPAQPLTIIFMPASQAVTLAASLTLTVGVTGTGPFSYQWRLNGVDLPAAHASSLALPPFGPAQEGTWEVVVSNPTRSVTSAPATLLLSTPVRFALVHSATNQFQSWLVGQPNINFIVESSDDLKTWAPVSTALPTNGLLKFQESMTSSNRFYRFHQTP